MDRETTPGGGQHPTCVRVRLQVLRLRKLNRQIREVAMDRETKRFEAADKHLGAAERHIEVAEDTELSRGVYRLAQCVSQILAALSAPEAVGRVATGDHEGNLAYANAWAAVSAVENRLAAVEAERDRLLLALDESTTDLVVTSDNILCEIRRGQKQWDGVYEHLRERIDANRKLAPLRPPLSYRQ